MNTRIPLLIFIMPCFVPASAFSQSNSLSEDSLPQPYTQFTNEIELGLGYISDDSYKFGRYNGLEDKGGFLIGNFKSVKFYDDAFFWNIEATDLGLDTRSITIENGVQGKFKVFLDYDKLPNYKDDTVKSPYAGVGNSNLTLPAGFNINAVNTFLNGFDQQTERESISVGMEIIPVQRWQFNVDVGRENKEGVDIVGGAIANGMPAAVRNTQTALLPEPVDYDTNTVDATLSYVGASGQLDFQYHMSVFENSNEFLNWQNPFNPLLSSGRLSLPPDNEFHQFAVTGLYSLPYKSQLTGLLSMGRMTQDDNFQPYTVNTGIGTSALPRTSFDGEVWLTNAQVKLTSRPIDKLRLNAEFRYNERDNDSPVDTYNPIVLDSHADTAIKNRPLSYTNNRINLDANYRINTKNSLHAGYKYNDMQRDYTNAEREDTDEHTLFARWKVKPLSDVDLTLFTEYSDRDGDSYVPLNNENPAMRKFHLADRKRNKVGASVDYFASENLLVSARAEYNKDDYDNTSIGLTEETQPAYTLDFSWQAASNVSIYGYYTYENYESSQSGQDVYPFDTTTYWDADFDDNIHTVGLGAKMTGIGKWDLGADIVYSKSDGEIDMQDLANPGTEDQYPDTETDRTSIKLWANYQYNKQLSYKIGYWYEDYSADNWAIDGLQAYSPTVENILLLDNDTQDYDVHVIAVSATYRF